jgi:hypothetical protein
MVVVSQLRLRTQSLKLGWLHLGLSEKQWETINNINDFDKNKTWAVKYIV